MTELKTKFMQLLNEIMKFPIPMEVRGIGLTIQQIDTILGIKTVSSSREFIILQPNTYIYEPEELYFIISDIKNQFKFIINSNKIPFEIINEFYNCVLNDFEKTKNEKYY